MTTRLEYDILAAKTFDLGKWFAEIIRVAKPTAPILVFSSGKFTYKMVNLGWQYFRYELIWDKVNKITGTLDSNVRPLLNHEFVLYFSKTFARSSNKSNLERNVYNHEVLYSKTMVKKHHALTLYGKTGSIEYKKLNNKHYPKSILRYNKANIKWLHPSEKPFALIERLIKLYSHPSSIVLDTFSGSGVVAHACLLNDRNFIATELDAKFYELSIQRINNCMFASTALANKQYQPTLTQSKLTPSGLTQSGLSQPTCMNPKPAEECPLFDLTPAILTRDITGASSYETSNYT